MGNSQSDTKGIHNMDEFYKVIKRYPDGSNMLEERSTGKQYLLRQITSNLEGELERLKMAVEKRKGKLHQHQLKIKEIQIRTQTILCMDQFKLSIMIEYPFRNLFDEVEEHRLSGEYFSQNELWSILYSCSLGLKHIYSYKGRHQSLSSYRIYIDKDGLVKVGDPFIMGHSTNYEHRRMHIPDHHIYLSPQQIDILKNPKHPYNPEASDVFTLGMIMTEVSNLAYLDELYEQDRTLINMDRLKKNLDEIAMRYSHRLRSTLDKMTRFEPTERITFSDVIQSIQSQTYDDEEPILSGMPYKIIPDKPSTNDTAQYSIHGQDKGKGNGNGKRLDEVKPTRAPNLKINNNSKENVAIFSTSQTNAEKNWDRDTMEKLTTNHSIKDSQNVNISNYDYKLPPTNTVYRNPVPYSIRFNNSRPSPMRLPGASYTGDNSSSYTNGSTSYYTSSQLPSTFSINGYTPTSSYSSNYISSGYQPTTTTLGITSLGLIPSWSVTSSYKPIYPLTTNSTNSYVTPLSSDPYTSVSKKPYTETISPYNSFSTTTALPKLAVDIITQTVSNIPQLNKKVQDNTVIDSALKNNLISPSLQKQSVSPVKQLQTPERKKKQLKNPNAPNINNNDSDSSSKSNSSNSGGSSVYQQVASLLPNSIIAEVTENEFSGNSEDSRKYEVLEYEQGSRYEGYTLHGMRHGFGKFYYQDGGHYEGEWKDNKMNGFAKLYYQNNDLAYEGYWKDEQFHGKGKVYNDNPRKIEGPFDYTNLSALDECWIYYEGEFDEDAKHGFGTVKLSNGEAFQGEFQRDVISGEGRFYTINGDVIHGIWRQNRLVNRLQQQEK